MSIDFAVAVAGLAEAFARQFKASTLAQQAIAPLLGKRRAAAQAAEIATRQFPVLRFVDGAVTLVLGAGQKGVLSQGPSRSFGAQLAGSGIAFAEGLAGAAKPFRRDSEATVINRFAGSVAGSLADIERSVREYSKPSAKMFDPRNRSASALFGEAALALRVLGEASARGGILDRFTEQVRGTLRAAGVPTPTQRLLGELTGPVAPTLPENLDSVARLLGGAVTVLLALPELLTTVLTGVRISLGAKLLDQLGALEKQVLDVRGSAFDGIFAGLFALADRGVALARAATGVVGANLLFGVHFWRTFGAEALTSVGTFVVDLGRGLGDVVELLRALPSWLTAALDFKVALGISLGSLFNDTGTGPSAYAQNVLNGALTIAEIGAYAGEPLAGEDGLAEQRRQVELAQQIADAVFAVQNPPELAREGSALSFRSDFPNLGEIVFGKASASRLTGVLDHVEHGFRSAGAAAFDRTGAAFTDLASQFTGVNLAECIGSTGASADSAADALFGADLAHERAAIAARPANGLALGFESWLSGQGFELIARVVSGYVGELATGWRTRLTAATELTTSDTPTSPHILRRRAVLAQVTVPKVTLRASPGALTDEQLADVLAGQFENVVRGAYDDGEKRLRVLNEAGGR